MHSIRGPNWPQNVLHEAEHGQAEGDPDEPVTNDSRTDRGPKGLERRFVEREPGLIPAIGDPRRTEVDPRRHRGARREDEPEPSETEYVRFAVKGALAALTANRTYSGFVVASGSRRCGPVSFVAGLVDSTRAVTESCSSVRSMSARGGTAATPGSTVGRAAVSADSGHRCSASACRTPAQASATRMSDSRIGALDVDDTRSRSATASVTSRSTSVMAAASVS